MADTTTTQDDVSVSAKVPEKKKTRKTRIKWDEEVIKEHDKLRGTREKIDEPDTPFNHDYVDSDDDDGMQAGERSDGKKNEGHLKERTKKIAIEDQMDELKASLASNPKSRWEDEAEHDPEEQKRRAKAAFAKKRAAHYNMGEQMRLAKLAIQRELEEEERANQTGDGGSKTAIKNN